MKNSTLFFIITLVIKTNENRSFFDLAKENLLKYDSEEYRKEPASINPEYYTPKGINELENCRIEFNTNYEKCSQYKICNICSANSDCAWCDEKKVCIPTDLNSRNDQIIPICQGDCIKLIKIDYCYKVIFEPSNTQGEINFSNYDQLEGNNLIESDDENIFEKTLEKNFLDENKHKFKEINQENNSILNYNPEYIPNKPLSLNLQSHHKQLISDMTNISKDVFTHLIDKTVKKDKNIKMVKPNLDNKDDLFKYLKEYIPNFEFPQYIKSDLEESIDEIKKEKILLWLRGYSLNDDISKTHLPIYKNITFINEDQVRKSVLDQFYKQIINDPNKSINSKFYNDMIDNTKKIDPFRNKTNIFYKFAKPLNTLNIIKKSNIRFKEEDNITFKQISNKLKNILKELK